MSKLRDLIKGLGLAPSANEWAASRDALKAGNLRPVAELLQRLALPLEWAEIMQLAVKAEPELERAIADDSPVDPEQLDRELRCLRNAQPRTVEEATQFAARIPEVEKAWGQAMSKRGLAADARGRLTTMHAYFPELFGHPDDQTCNGFYLPSEVQNAIHFAFRMVPPRWSDYRRDPVAEVRRRKIRAAGFMASPAAEKEV